MTDNKIIKIFLASSSELEDDRKEFEIFINRENKNYQQQRIFLELVLWEDFQAWVAQESLQDEYNKAVANCDVFVCLFYTKVGKYSEQEFKVALEAFEKNGKPYIFTYFKELPTSFSKNGNLLNFKRKLKILNHYPTTYKEISDLKYHFWGQLRKLIQTEFKDIQKKPGLLSHQVKYGDKVYLRNNRKDTPLKWLTGSRDSNRRGVFTRNLITQIPKEPFDVQKTFQWTICKDPFDPGSGLVEYGDKVYLRNNRHDSPNKWLTGSRDSNRRGAYARNLRTQIQNEPFDVQKTFQWTICASPYDQIILY